jgi:catechol 2,3-dioxygenase-like lactoylglutathione lyase family enzyme
MEVCFMSNFQEGIEFLSCKSTDRLTVLAVFLMSHFLASFGSAAERPYRGIDYIKGIHLRVTNLEASTRFYSEVLGLKPAMIKPNGEIKNAVEVIMTVSGVFDLKGTPILALELVHPEAGALAEDRSTYGHMVVVAPDAAGIAARAKAAGYGAVKQDQYVTMLTGPDGYRTEVVQPPSMPRRSRKR